MRRRKVVVGVVIALATAACGGGGGDTSTTDANLVTDLDSPIVGFGGAVDRANDVADASNDRLADIQNQLEP
jgi:hypothetical protein